MIQAFRATKEILGLQDLKEVKEKQDHGEHKEQETSANVVMKSTQELRFHLVQLLLLKFQRQRLVILFLLPFQVH